jgi:hypothetical protein
MAADRMASVRRHLARSFRQADRTASVRRHLALSFRQADRTALVARHLALSFRPRPTWHQRRTGRRGPRPATLSSGRGAELGPPVQAHGRARQRRGTSHHGPGERPALRRAVVVGCVLIPEVLEGDVVCVLSVLRGRQQRQLAGRLRRRVGGHRSAGAPPHPDRRPRPPRRGAQRRMERDRRTAARSSRQSPGSSSGR